MTCSNVSAKLSAYLDGEICGVDMMMISGHLQHCSSCRSELEEIRAIKHLMCALPGAEPSEALVERLKQRIATESSSSARMNWWTRPQVWLPAAAAIVIGIAVLTRQGPSAVISPKLDPTNRMDQVVVETSPRFNAEFDQAMQAGADPIGGSSPIITVNHGGN